MTYAVYEITSGKYYHGNGWRYDTKRYSAVFGELDTGIKTYGTQKKAEAAIRCIISVTGFDSPETLEVVSLGENDVMKLKKVPEPDKPETTKEQDCLSCPYFLDKPADSLPEKPEPEEPPPLYPVPEKETKGWELVAFVGEKKKPPLMLRRKQFADVTEYAIMLADGILYYLPGDELLAWSRYYDECKNFVCGRIRERRIKEGRDPDGMDEWR